MCGNNVNIQRSTVAYPNVTINVKPKTQNRGLELTGVSKPGESRGLTGTGLGLARQESAGRVFGQVWNRNDPFLESKPGPLAAYLEQFLTLMVGITPYALNHFVYSSSQNRSFLRIPFRCHARCARLLMMGCLRSSSSVLQQHRVS